MLVSTELTTASDHKEWAKLVTECSSSIVLVHKAMGGGGCGLDHWPVCLKLDMSSLVLSLSLVGASTVFSCHYFFQDVKLASFTLYSSYHITHTLSLFCLSITTQPIKKYHVYLS